MKPCECCGEITGHMFWCRHYPTWNAAVKRELLRHQTDATRATHDEEGKR